MNNFKLSGKHLLLPVLVFISLVSCFSAKAQCPPNIDFEEGTWNGWTCYRGGAGSYGPDGMIHLSATDIVVPTAPRHTIITTATVPATDQWGGFPKLCPNGSNYSIKIGNESTGTTADRATYTFTIPAGQNEFSLIYHYAIVINNTGAHAALIQPRLRITVRNITDNILLPCDSLDRAYSNGSPLAGFKDAPANSQIKYRPWAANSVNLDGMAGKTFELSFTMTGCGATGGTHFGYAYLDVNTECGSSFIGAEFCPDDAFINVTAPYGYNDYKWYDDVALTHQIGTGQVINFTPPPATGTDIYVQMTPLPDFGCPNTLKAKLNSTLTVVADAGADKLLCNATPSTQLGVAPKPGLVYSWSPVTGLSDPNISNPIFTATGPGTTHYTLTVKHEGGGCLTTDDVDVTVSHIDNTLTLTGSDNFCVGQGNATLSVAPTDQIQWYDANGPIPGATGTQLVITQSGTYYAKLHTTAGCDLNTASRTITVNPKPTPGFAPDNATVCFYNHKINFTNSSTITSGTPLTYFWDFGDNSPTESTRDVSHSYALPGTYMVRMIVTSDQGCQDSTKIPVTVNPSPDRTLAFTGVDEFCERGTASAVLSVQPAATIQWYNGTTAIPGANGTQYTVTQTGNYHAVLSTALGCSVTTDDKMVTVHITPLASVNATTPLTQCFKGNVFNFTNNSTIAGAHTMLYSWDYGDNSTVETTANATHSYATPGNYRVRMLVTGDEGCMDSSIFNITVNPTPDNSMVLTGDGAVICEAPGRNAILTVQPADNIQWYWNSAPIPGATSTQLIITQTGDYYAILKTNLNCSATTATQTIKFNPTPKAGFVVNNPKQCDTNNSFLFSDTSKIASGTMLYSWDYGDGSAPDPSKNGSHTYKRGGIYHVKQTVTSNNGCIDSATYDIVIYVSPIPDFTVKSTCSELPVLIANKTLNNTNTNIHYLWDFGNGDFSNDRDPHYTYHNPGTYTIKLEVSTDLCMVLLNTVVHDIYIEAPVPGITYPDVTAVTNYREQLQARSFGVNYLWSPATSLSNTKTAAPLFQGVDPQLYSIKITTSNGCVTVDTQYVKTAKKIKIYVPNSFTPNGDGKNDYLFPGLMGYKELNYFKVYDRWGKLLFVSKSDLPGWDGRFNGQYVETQTVVWQIQAVDIDGKVHQEQGTTVVVR